MTLHDRGEKSTPAGGMNYLDEMEGEGKIAKLRVFGSRISGSMPDAFRILPRTGLRRLDQVQADLLFITRDTVRLVQHGSVFRERERHVLSIDPLQREVLSVI